MYFPLSYFLYNLNYKVAVPAKAWEGVFDASEEGPSCPRVGGQLIQDDCLCLNVYTRKVFLLGYENY